jgi:tRNA pseudouridine38-40 synthase
MPHFKITIAYDGTGYVGWQRQASGPSVQGLLEGALRDLDERDVTLTGAGRTDAGVHALGQVAGFTLHRVLPASAIVRALNARLPDAVRVLSAEEVPSTFHPRFGARRKTYRYRIWNGEVISPFERRYAWHLVAALDAGAMQAAAERLVGRHDFSAFQATGSPVSTTQREIFASEVAAAESADGRLFARVTAGLKPCATSGETTSRPPGTTWDVRGAGLQPCDALIVYEITGTGFLRHMVRIIVGTLVEIGRGRQPVEWIDRLLTSRDRTVAGPTAPPEGLFLVTVEYGDALAAEP